MSLILDALKQADSERARGQVPGVFSPALQAEEPPKTRRSRLVWWLLLAATAAAALLWFIWPLMPWGTRAAPATHASPAPRPAPAPVAVPPPANTALFLPNAMVAPAPAPAAPASTTALPPPPIPAPRAEAPVQSAADLPADARAELPNVHITGHTYSDNPTLRMLMIDGHMVVEGQAISPGLRLERIGPHQAVFNHRGTRFSVDY